MKVERLLAGTIKLIEDGLLKPGERLRSIRAGAAEHGVSKNTMAEAYERLVALGYLESRRGAGYFVSRLPRKSAQSPPPHVTEAVDIVSFLREQLEQHHEVRVGDGRPPPSWMEGPELGNLPRTGGRGQRSHFGHGYGSPWGHAPLRERIALLLAERSIDADPAQVLLTQGANHALDLLVRHLVEPGDTVLVDSPGYYPLFGKLRLAKVETVGVARRADGPDIDDLAAKAAAHRPKVFFTQSLAHNPTGGSITLAGAHRVLQLASRHGFLIVEDDPFADILPAASPRLAALDQLENVVYVSSFSKTLSASLRVGYIAAAPPLAQALCDLKMVTHASTSDFVERLVYDLVASGQYARLLRRLKARLAEATAGALAGLADCGLQTFAPPSGGYYLWVELPPHLDDRELAREAAAEGIFLAPGSVFRLERGPAPPAMRANVAYVEDPRFLGFMRRRLAADGAR